MGFYDELAVVAGDVLTEFGRSATLYKSNPQPYDPETGKTPVSVGTHAITVVIGEQPEATLANSAVVSKQRRAIIKAVGLPVSIDNGDIVAIGAERFKVVDPGAVSPAGTVVIYDAVLES